MHLALTMAAAILTAAPETSAIDALKSRDAEIRAALPPSGAPVTPAIKAKLEVILTKIVDLEAIAKDVLGKQWDAQKESKRREFLDAFMSAFRSALSGELDGYRSAKTEFAPEEQAGDRVKVPTTLTIKGEPTSVVYTMKKETSGWRIVDITIDDVSTVENYRSSFGRIVQKEGFDSLIARLKKKQTS